MKNVLLIILFFLFSFFLFAQEPEWLWAERAGGSSYDNGYAICSDTVGNIYVTGYFQHTADFGPNELTSLGGSDIYVAKIDANGNWIWITQAGGTAWDISQGISIDSEGNIYVTGYFAGTINFGSTSLTSSGNNDIFVAMTSNNGIWSWAKKAGGNAHDRGKGICVGTDGNIYVTGFFTDIGTFGSFSLTSSSIWDIFVAKMDSEGNWLWAKQAGGYSNDLGEGINADADGNIYVTGWFKSSASFGSYNLNSFGDKDIFVAKLNTEGEWLWAVQAGSSDLDEGNAISADNQGNIFVVGIFHDSANFGPINLSCYGSSDMFIAKLDMNGHWLFAKQAGGYIGSGKSVITDIEGNVYMTGNFSGTASFGSYNLTSYGGLDIFIAKIDNDGEWLWACHAGSTASDRTHGISIDADGNVYTTGCFLYTAIFGAFSITSVSNIYEDIFVAKFGYETTICNEITILKNSISNYPNPFNPVTTIVFNLPEPGQVKLEIYNIKGQKVKTLVNDKQEAGAYSIIWNGRDSNGNRVGSGIYFYKLKVGKHSKVKKMLLLK